MNIKLCPCCNQETLHSFEQASLIPGKLPARRYFECRNPDCDMFMATLTEAQYLERCEQVNSK